MKSVLTRNQKREFKALGVMLDGQKVDVIATVRYDDECKNGHNSFAVTASIYAAGKRGDRNYVIGGCCHDEIAATIPKLAPYIKWHLCSSDMPMHYYANTMYHARDTDHNGLKKGEYSAYIKIVKADITDSGAVAVYTTGTLYTNKQNNPNLEKGNVKELTELKLFTDSLIVPFIIEDVPAEWSISQGKEINLEAARSCAIWPDATLKQLQSREALEARLPALMEEFKTTVESLGFTY